MPGWLRTSAGIAGRLLIAGALLDLIFTRIPLAATGQVLITIQPLYALTAAGVMLVVAIFAAAKWHILLRALSTSVSFRTILRLTYIAVTWNLALPGGESGNLVKAGILAHQRRNEAGSIWASMLIDQVSLAAAQFIMAFFTLALATYPPPNVTFWLTVSALGLTGLATIYALFLLPIARTHVDNFISRISRLLAVPNWLRRTFIRAEAAPEEDVAEFVATQMPRHRPGEWLAPLWFALRRYQGHLPALLGGIGYAILYYAAIFSAYWLASLGLGLPFNYADIAWVTALAGIASLLPITFAGVGVREGIITYFFQQRGIAAPTALAFSLAVLILNIVLGLPGIFLQLRGNHISSVTDTPPIQSRA